LRELFEHRARSAFNGDEERLLPSRHGRLLDHSTTQLYTGLAGETFRGEAERLRSVPQEPKRYKIAVETSCLVAYKKTERPALAGLSPYRGDRT
jgi:hypothetical protein